MTKKIGDKKVGGVKSTKETTGVEGTDLVSGVGNVKATTAVGGIGRAGAVGSSRLTRTMSLAEREQLFKMINEEADKLAQEGLLPKAKRQAVESAVKMAIDAGLLPSEDEDSGKGKKNR